ncbi:BON domain-containing protein [Paludibacterium purpuratum]|uniref:Osmotically-inducible protein OsmY n=1 Tax=Paludibacterium purpuratum TaxID=1144873 RepID=A0A4R7B809_9NEIS|nr:BON domain-containing protein [Paludibacterium purpuratum]TDR80653.1 osmotically-inducible protein OsmY [Paludibacterium purpuratum]
MMRRSLMTVLLAAALGSALSGCFPLIAGGVAGTAMVASDRRTSGAYVDDQSIELKASSQLSNKFPNAHINVNSFNRTALMTGEVASDDERLRAEMVVRALPGVKRVENYTVVADPTTFSQRNNDTWITTKVRSRLVSGKGNYSSQAIKLVTERGVVYMMGLVTREEGDAVAEVASQTAGVQKVVTLFEYLNAIPALPADASSAQ